AARRRALGFTQESLADRLGVHPMTVRRWESGGIGGSPQPWARRALAQLLEISPEELEELLSDGHGLLSWVVADDEDDVNRRALLKLLGGATLAAPFAIHLEYLRRGLDAALGAPTSAADIEEWERTAFRYASEIDHLPYAQVLPALMADLGEVQARLVRISDALRPRMAYMSGRLTAP